MCYAILRISYKSSTESPACIVVEKREEMEDKIKELRNRDGVRKITSFLPHMTTELVSEWQETQHVMEVQE
ncbi:MAG TPA: hypothetical protein VIY48_00630 [Candidatus Paceibacterota bacterium]